VRIPAVLHLPGQGAPATDDRMVDLTDFTATLLDLAGADVADTCGHSITDPAWAGRDTVVSEFYEANWVRPIVEQRVAMIRDNRFKLVVTEHQGEELYDMHDSPLEVNNHISDPTLQAHAQRLRGLLAQAVPWTAAAV
jgi:arylsulfatase A-like enzyme